MAITKSLTGAISEGAGAAMFRNRIINGDMRIDQRNAGASITTGVGSNYAVDRFSTWTAVASKFTTQRNAGSGSLPAGFTNYLGASSSSSYIAAAGDYFLIQQAIEGYNIADLAWGTANAKTITVSFWVYSSLTGTFALSVRNGPLNRNYVTSYTISSPNTWTYITITVPGDTTGTWPTDNTAGLLLGFDLGTGSTYYATSLNTWGSQGSTNQALTFSSATKVVGTSGATFYITGVQLEKGTAATPFEYRNYGAELALCQRYYYKATDYSGTSAYTGIAQGAAYSATGVTVYGPLPVTMRTRPVPTFSNIRIYQFGSALSNTSFTMSTNWSSTNMFGADLVVSGFTSGQPVAVQTNNNVAGYVEFNAEL